ncbi:uncharacterized protein BJ212DRAFT_1306501 [Suillus subaureus]|uniref:Uncharacterized protein n=1 Tax=Suillus subaureus TaxID=48587 RepID=A0A9P7AT66_9AGAM|nr:uncharacterized protein BJ212DRAFT_1306501 [Suillus subaureus]KAG1795825.1 hypothetical protein BJ212DRAFT_1306501 [Suillus subaureus]
MVDNMINCLDTGMWFLIKIILCRDYGLKYKYIDQRLVGQIGTKWKLGEKWVSQMNKLTKARVGQYQKLGNVFSLHLVLQRGFLHKQQSSQWSNDIRGTIL